MATSTAPTMVQPGLDLATAYVFTTFPNVVHLRDSERVDRTVCDQAIRYYARPGDARSWPLCHTCERSRES